MNAILDATVGFITLLAAGGVLAGAVYFAGVWHDVTRPGRRGMGWALGNGLASSPQDLGMQFTERTIQLKDGLMPSWWIAGQQPSSHLAVIILHGHGRSRWDALRRATPFVQRAALVVLPDLRGHGDAPGRSSLGRREAADVCLLIATIEAEMPGIKIILAGHSLGAVVAIHAAALRAEAGTPIQEVHAWGPYDALRTALEARLRLRALPRWPVSSAVLALLKQIDGAERTTCHAAQQLRETELTVYSDECDTVSPVNEGKAIASTAPRGRVVLSAGVPHGDLGTRQ